MTLQHIPSIDKGNETKSHYCPAEDLPISYSYAFLNKAELKGKASYTLFRPVTLSLSLLIQHILEGYAFMPAQHAPLKRVKESFQRARLLALDFDNDASGSLPVSVQALRNHPFVGRFAAFIYATPTSTPARPKSRALFVLDSLLLSVSDYERAAAALMDVCSDLQPDKACKDVTRLFFGSTEADHDIDTQAVLKLSLLDELAELQEARAAANTETQKHQNTAAPHGVDLHTEFPDYAPVLHSDSLADRRRRRYVESALERNMTAIAQAALHTRNNTLYRKTAESFRLMLAAPDLLSRYDIIAAAERAAQAAGLSPDETIATIESAERRATTPATLPVFEAELRLVWPIVRPAPDLPEHQDNDDSEAEPIHQDDKPVYAALADSIRYLVASESKPAAALLNALYAAQACGQLNLTFDLQDVMGALAAMGCEAPEKTLYRSLKWLRDAELLRTESAPDCPPDEFFSKKSHREPSLTTCDFSEKNSNRGRRRSLMALPPAAELMARLRQFIAIQVLDSLYPEAPARPINAHEIDPYYLAMIVRSLEALNRRPIKALKAQNLLDVLPEQEKPFAAGLLDLIQAVPAMATAQALIETMDMSRAAAERAAAALSAIRIATSPLLAQAMELKWALMSRMYRARVESLDNPLSTPLALELDGQAFINSLSHARAKELNGQAVSGRAMAEIIGIHDRRAAYRAAKRLGIDRQERKEIIALPEPTKEAIKAAERSARGKCLRIVAIAQDGSVLSAKPAHEVSSLPLDAARYEAHIQQASLMLVGQLPARIERAQREIARPQDVAPETETNARAAQPERVPRKRLYTASFLLSRILAPRIAQHAGLWVHPETGELFDDPKQLVYALIDETTAQAV